MLLTAALSSGITQAEVDFVIPNISRDLPLCIDPFLLFKSREPRWQVLHDRLLAVFGRAFELFDAGRLDDLAALVDFPECAEIGFGFSRRSGAGRGLGETLNRALVELLSNSAPIRRRGLRHIEELQLLSIGVGPDRVSDVVGNILKKDLIEYTREQAAFHNIPVRPNVPVPHFFDFDAWDWSDGYFELPVNPVTGQVILFVPRRLSRQLPWINYEDYAASTLRDFLRPKPSHGRTPRVGKPKAVEISREHLAIVDKYVDRKEQAAGLAQPATGASWRDTAATDLVDSLRSVPAGRTAAADYQDVVFRVLNYLFEPELTDGEKEVSTYHGTERRDIIYTNESETSFWAYVRTTYGTPVVMFEVKNKEALESDDLNQVATYLGARIGHLGLIVSRRPSSEKTRLKAFSIFNDTASAPRKIVLILCDDDLVEMINARSAGRPPAKHLQGLYRAFRTSVQ